MKTEAQKRAQQRYMDAHSKLQLTIPNDQKNRWKTHATARGQSLTAYITELVEADLKKSQGE